MGQVMNMFRSKESSQWGSSQWGLKSFEQDKKVWIGGVTPPGEGATEAIRGVNKQLQEHMKWAGVCKFAEIGKNGTGGAAFASAEDAQKAIATLNGSLFNGAIIQVDVWEKKPAGHKPAGHKPAGYKQPNNAKGGGKGNVQMDEGNMQVLNMFMAMMKDQGKGSSKWGSSKWGSSKWESSRWGLQNFEHDKKVWIGGVTPAGEGATREAIRDVNKQLQEHMKQAGECKFAQIGKSGTGGAAFASAEDAIKAIATLNGSLFNGAFIQLDVWEKKEKNE